MDIVDVVGGDQGYAKLSTYGYQPLVDGRQHIEVVILDLQVIVVEDLSEPLGALDGVIGPAFQNKPWDFSRGAAREDDQAFVMLL